MAVHQNCRGAPFSARPGRVRPRRCGAFRTVTRDLEALRDWLWEAERRTSGSTGVCAGHAVEGDFEMVGTPSTCATCRAQDRREAFPVDCRSGPCCQELRAAPANHPARAIAGESPPAMRARAAGLKLRETARPSGCAAVQPGAAAPGPPGADRGRGLARDQRPEHGAAGHAEDVGSDALQLDVGGLQELQEPVAFSRLALRQLAAIAQQIAQLTQVRGGTKLLQTVACSGPDRRSTRNPSRRSCAPARCACAGRCRRSARNAPRARRRRTPDARALHPTCVAPASHSQSRNASRSRVTVRNVRTSLVGRAPGEPTRRHATTVSRCTSRPQHRSMIACIVASFLPEGDRDAGRYVRDTAMRAPRSQGRQRMVPLCSAGRTPNRGCEPPQFCQPQHDRPSRRLRQIGPRRHHFHP